MKREHLEHLIRAASTVTGDTDIVVIGSQAILAKVPDASGILSISMEADMFPKTRIENANEIDGALGEMSPFHRQFGYYASMVGSETPVAPRGWQDRLIPISGDNTNGATGWCMDPHDLVVAKLAAGRAKDLAFCQAAIAAQAVDVGILRTRITMVEQPGIDVRRIYAYLDRCLNKGER